MIFRYTAEPTTKEYISVLKLFLYVQDSQTKIRLLFECFSDDLGKILRKSLTKVGIWDPILTLELSNILGGLKDIQVKVKFSFCNFEKKLSK